MLTGRTWLLLGGLALFSLGVLGVVQLWPAPGGSPGGRGTVATSASVSHGGNVGIRVPLAPPGEDARESASGQVSSGQVAEARTTVPLSHSPAIVADHAPRPSGESFSPYPAAPQASNASTDLQLSERTPETVSSPILDQPTLEELALRLSSLLAVLSPSPSRHAPPPSGSFTERSLDGTDGPASDSFWHASGHSGHVESFAMASQEFDAQKVDTPPMVHVSVHQRKTPSDIAGIRPLEEEMGRALRAGDWAAFDLAYGQLASLQAGDALVQWRAARAMAGADHEQARELLEILYRDNPFDLGTGLNLALVHEAQGEVEKARNIARTLARRHPLDPGLQGMLDRLENTRAR